jgi:hypothetical protein
LKTSGIPKAPAKKKTKRKKNYVLGMLAEGGGHSKIKVENSATG